MSFLCGRRLTAAVALLLLAAGISVCAGEDEIAATEATAPSRDRLYDDLAADVEELERRGSILKRVVRLVTPAVVHIDARRDSIDGRPLRRDTDETGSGVVIERRGKYYVLTNRHVIRHSSPSRIDIKLADGRIVRPAQVWSDPPTDIAIMEIRAEGISAARIGDSSRVEIGDFALAVGSPFGLSHSVTYGIISAKGRRNLNLGDDSLQYQDFLQTDAAINPGNSGGPLLNLRGELIGINTAIASSSGVSEGFGFAIPINMAMLVADQLVDSGSVTRAYLGVRLDSSFGPEAAVRLGLSRPQGARVSGLTRGSPAELARIAVGDVILEFDGIRIDNDVHLINVVALTPVSKEVEVRLFRSGQPISLRLRVGNRSEMPAE
jgi:serine protease Do